MLGVALVVPPAQELNVLNYETRASLVSGGVFCAVGKDASIHMLGFFKCGANHAYAPIPHVTGGHNVCAGIGVADGLHLSGFNGAVV